MFFCLDGIFHHVFSFVGLLKWLSGKNLPANAGAAGAAGAMGCIPGSGRSPGGGNGNTLQFSYQDNPVDRGTWWATVYWVAKNWTQLSMKTHTHTHTHTLVRSLMQSSLEDEISPPMFFPRHNHFG